MLTPVDIQQKKFHVGIGFDKKDVSTFFDSVSESYEQLYRSNAELTEKVATLTDALQHYKSKESALEKSLMLAEKDSEDTKSRATKEAKNIELDAKNRAKVIIGDAEERLQKIQDEMTILEAKYAAYKSNFSSLLKQQFEFLQENDYDVNAYIDDRALELAGAAAADDAGSDSFGSFGGDPQMREGSPLGGLGGGYAGSSRSSSMDANPKRSTSAVYTAGLSSNDSFVDPFNPTGKKQPGRYNPYDDMDKKAGDKTTGSKQSFKVNNKNNDKVSFKGASAAGSVKQSQTARNNSQRTTSSAAAPKPEKPASSEASDKPKPAPRTEAVKETAKEEVKPEVKKNNGPIPTVDLSMGSKEEEKENITADAVEVEIKVDGKALLGDGVTFANEDTDSDGFEFV